jgi:thymidylate kinase
MIPAHSEKDPVEACYQLSVRALTQAPTASGFRRRLFCVMLGLDGSGKTTLARHLAEHIGSTMPPLGLRYFHFIPTSSSRPLFPWPDQVAEPKKREPSRGTGGRLASIARLVRNWIRALWALGVRSRHFGGVLLGDRYLYNYILDPASVRYFGPAWLAARFLQLAPRPDLLFILETTPDILLQRKRELPPDEIRAQSAILREFPFAAARVIRLDATRAPGELAQECLREILLTSEKR